MQELLHQRESTLPRTSSPTSNTPETSPNSTTGNRGGLRTNGLNLLVMEVVAGEQAPVGIQTGGEAGEVEAVGGNPEEEEQKQEKVSSFLLNPSLTHGPHSSSLPKQ